jgi:tellurite resistance protein TehA-like permease
MYMAIAFITSALQYLQLFTGVIRLTLQGMTPAWILPIFPILLGGVLAGIVASDQPPMSALTIIICGITYLGLGWMIAFLMYAVFLHRLMQHGLPPPNLRPGMFITAGPPCFTGAALIGFGDSLAVTAGQGYFIDNYRAIGVLQTVTNFAAIFLWAFGFWFFCVSLVAVLAGVREMTFHLIWWALVFPNIALALATARIGEELKSEGIMWIASVMTILLVAAWIFVIFLNVRAVIRGEIM